MFSEMLDKALANGFAKAAVIDAKELVYVPEYRKFCEENLCGNYNKLPVCPPVSFGPGGFCFHFYIILLIIL